MKILSLNLHKGFGPFNLSFSLPDLKILLKSSAVDFVFLQEVHGLNIKLQEKMPDWPNSSQYEYLADQIWLEYAYAKNSVYSHGHHGNAILSKYPIVFEQKVDLTVTSFEKRSLLHCIVEVPSTKTRVHLLNLHLNLRHRHRVQQWNVIQDYLKKEISSNEAVIMAGDFNDWHTGLDSMIKESFKFYESSNEFLGQFSLTFPSYFPKLPLDRIYFKNAELVHFEKLEDRVWKLISDHLPIQAEFKLFS